MSTFGNLLDALLEGEKDMFLNVNLIIFDRKGNYLYSTNDIKYIAYNSIRNYLNADVISMYSNQNLHYETEYIIKIDFELGV